MDYIRFLQFSGCREREALRVRWSNVDLEIRQMTIGAMGGAKNREVRIVDLNRYAEKHLREMRNRRAPDSQ